MGISAKAVKTLKEQYLGQQVIIYLSGMNIVAPTSDGNGVDVSAMVQGVIIDLDTDFLYLGLPDGTPTQSIPMQTVGLIELLVPVEELGLFDLPTDEDGIH